MRQSSSPVLLAGHCRSQWRRGSQWARPAIDSWPPGLPTLQDCLLLMPHPETCTRTCSQWLRPAETKWKEITIVLRNQNLLLRSLGFTAQMSSEAMNDRACVDAEPFPHPKFLLLTFHLQPFVAITLGCKEPHMLQAHAVKRLEPVP